ncbi:hypothetical protein JL101_022540 [Skermanella rosea]|uniref:hypothetical protein n=1 Tax=Skermanella rosea TaxID=1817965 RepID=UPI0019335787|nr:hypothetical protein [Skermanella rosea]UEM02730.1 hypothetical protein JL101_022540 [Skermanella rosea]
MTVAIGMYCVDGVVIVTDSALTTGGPEQDGATSEMRGPKVHKLNDHAIFAYAGDYSLAERIRRRIEGLLDDWMKEAPDGLELADKISDDLQCFFEKRRKDAMHGNASIMLAFEINGCIELVTFGGQFVPTHYSRGTFYVAMGTGKKIADPAMSFLQVACDIKELRVDDAVVLAMLVATQVIIANPGGVRGPLQVQYLKRTDSGFEHVVLDDFSELNTKIKQINDRIRTAIFGSGVPARAAPMPEFNDR